MVKYDSKNGHQKYMFLKETRTTCSEDDNRFKLSSGHNLGDMCDHSMSTKIFNLVRQVYELQEL